jgi:hypothetical protein
MSCKDKVICPAFQSTYILDDSTRIAYFSYVWKLDKDTRETYFASLNTVDSSSGNYTNAGNEAIMPYYAHAANYVQRPETVNKTKYGIVKYEPMWLKNYNLKSVPMENVLSPDKPKPASIIAGSPSEMIVADSISTDSTSLAIFDSASLVSPVATKEKPKPVYLYNYDPNNGNNVEQEYYNKYFGKLLVSKKPAKVAPVKTDNKQPTKEISTDSTNTTPPKKSRKKQTEVEPEVLPESLPENEG